MVVAIMAEAGPLVIFLAVSRAFWRPPAARRHSARRDWKGRWS